MEEKKLIDRINLDSVQWETKTRSRNMPMRATYSPASKTICFSKKAVAALNIEKWEAVVVGYDRRSGIIAMKRAEATDYGAVSLMEGEAVNRKTGEKYKTGSRNVRIGHVVESCKFEICKEYRPERSGELILLEGNDGTK